MWGIRWLGFGLVFLFGLREGSGWSQEGYGAIGQTAISGVSGLALEHLKRLFGGRTLADATGWGRKLVNKYPEMESYHLQLQGGGVCERVSMKDCENKKCLLGVITQLYGRLMHPAKNSGDYGIPGLPAGVHFSDANALNYLITLIADLHNPVRLGNSSDHGGKDLTCEWNGADDAREKVTLWDLWQSKMVEKYSGGAEQFWYGGWTHISSIGEQWAYEERAFEKLGGRSFMRWGVETRKVVCQTIYDEFYEMTQITAPLEQATKGESDNGNDHADDELHGWEEYDDEMFDFDKELDEDDTLGEDIDHDWGHAEFTHHGDNMEDDGDSHLDDWENFDIDHYNAEDDVDTGDDVVHTETEGLHDLEARRLKGWKSDQWAIHAAIPRRLKEVRKHGEVHRIGDMRHGTENTPAQVDEVLEAAWAHIMKRQVVMAGARIAIVINSILANRAGEKLEPGDGGLSDIVEQHFTKTTSGHKKSNTQDFDFSILMNHLVGISHASPNFSWSVNLLINLIIVFIIALLFCVLHKLCGIRQPKYDHLDEKKQEDPVPMRPISRQTKSP